MRRLESQRAISLLVRTGIKSVIPPKWKNAKTYEAVDTAALEQAGCKPPPTSIDKNRAQQSDEEPVGKPGHTWKHPTTGDVYVNIVQPWKYLRGVQIAVRKNRESSDVTFSALEARPLSIRTELASDLHEQWQHANGSKLNLDDKLRSGFKDLPWDEKAKNMTWVNFILDFSAIAHQVQYSVNALFNADNDDMVSSDEFLKSDALRGLFQNSVRVPVRKGDIVKVRDLSKMFEDRYFDAVVVSWKTGAYWDPIKSGEDEESIKSKIEIEENQDDLEKYDFAGTVFLVRLVHKKDRNVTTGMTRARVNPSFAQSHVMYGAEPEFAAVPETALCWSDTKCSDFEKGILNQMDWLFDADGTSVVSDNRLVSMDPLKWSYKKGDADQTGQTSAKSNNGHSFRFPNSMRSWLMDGFSGRS